MTGKHTNILTALILLATLTLTLGTTTSYAQTDGLSTNSKEPLEVTADGTLEWLRNEQQFIATQNAVAKQGETSVAGEKLIARYREGQDGKNMEIYQITAEENVILKSRDSTVYGQNAVYNLDDGLATMTGDNLKMISPDQTVTARDKFEYWVTDGRVNAIGNAKVIRPKLQGGYDTLQANKISAILKKNEQGKQVLHSLEAIGNVVIMTPAETITGAYGIYKADTNKADLSGGVKILRGKNTLEGEKAEVDLNTNISTISSGKNPTNGTSSGRVRGVFYPGSEQKPDTP